MKKCPQCGREYDTSMMFCLDDGALTADPAVDDLRSDPRFPAILKKIESSRLE